MVALETTALPTVHASSVISWRIEDRGDQIEVIPTFPIASFALTLLVGIALFVIGRWFIGIDDSFRTIWSIVIPLLMLFAGVMSYLSYRTGPRLLIDRGRSTMSLPRIGRTWPLEDIVGWQIIVKPLDEERRQYTQLILIAREGEALARHLFIEGIGHRFPHRFREFIKRLEPSSGARLVSLVEDGSERLPL